MKSMKRFLNEDNVELEECYLQVGYKLAQGCYEKFCFKIDLDLLKESKNNKDEVLGNYGINKKTFWEKMRKLSCEEKEIYIKELTVFCEFMGLGN